MIPTKKDILDIIAYDSWMMQILICVKSLHLPDWWIGAGFVRSKVWDIVHEYKNRTPIPDIDVIYFDKNDLSEKTEKILEKKLSSLYPEISWQVKNQARMHTKHGHKPYSSSIDALSHWVETATCIGVKIDENNKLQLMAPLGISDLVTLQLRPISSDPKVLIDFHQRYKEKQWLIKWPKLKIVI